jgi:DNA-binding CsgD family transcriptional regulator
MGRHLHQHRALDDSRAWRTGRRGARPDPHPHGPHGGGPNRAKARGQHMGRPSKLTDAQKVEARRRAEGATRKELAESYDVGQATISKLTA